jgi:hypothetical protein
MATETCASCDAGLSARDPFCPRCGRPTPVATEEQILDWDLRLWQSHVDRAVASGAWNGGHAGEPSIGPLRSYRPAAATATAEAPPPPDPPRAVAPARPVRTPAAPPVPRPPIQVLPARFLSDDEEAVRHGVSRRRRKHLRLGNGVLALIGAAVALGALAAAAMLAR